MGTRNAVEVLMILSVRQPNNFAGGPPPIPVSPISEFASLEKVGGTAVVGLETLFEARWHSRQSATPFYGVHGTRVRSHRPEPAFWFSGGVLQARVDAAVGRTGRSTSRAIS